MTLGGSVANRLMARIHFAIQMERSCQHGRESFGIPPRQMDDDELIASCQAGCMECLEVVFHRYCRIVFAIAWKVLRQKDEVEDLVQELFLCLLSQRHHYDPSRGTVKTWISQFAHYMALSRRRILLKRCQIPLDDAEEFDLLSTRSAAAYSRNPERTILISECLMALNSRQRMVVEAVHLQGYTLQETADLLHESLANTRNLYYRGMKSIRNSVRNVHMAEVPSAGELNVHNLLKRVYLASLKIQEI